MIFEEVSHSVDFHLESGCRHDQWFFEAFWGDWNGRVVNGSHFEARTRPEPEITSPNPARARHLFLRPDLGRESQIYQWVKICATAGYQKT